MKYVQSVEECNETHFAVNLRNRTTLFYWRMAFLSKSSFYINGLPVSAGTYNCSSF